MESNNYIHNSDEKVLLILARDPGVRSRLQEYVKPGFFTSNEPASLLYKVLRGLPTPTEFALIDGVNGLKVDGQVKQEMRSLIGRIFASPAPDYRTGFAAAKEWLKHAHWNFITGKLFTEEDLSYQQRIVAMSGDSNDEISFPKTDIVDMLALLRAEEAEARFPFQASLPILNEVTRNGLKRGETALMLAGSGVGKTKWLCNLASQYAQQGQRVLYINLESKASDIWKTIAANLIKIPSDEIHKLIDEDAIQYDPSLRALNIMVRDLTGSATPADIPPIIEHYKLVHGQKPDVVLIDYMAEMSPSKAKVGKSDNSYTTIGKIYRELLDVARFHDVLIWSAAQFNREGIKEGRKKEGKVGVEHVAESYQHITKATLILCAELFHTDKETPVGYLNMKVLKYRHNNFWPSFHGELTYPFAQFREMSEEEWYAVVMAKAVNETEGADFVNEESKGDSKSQFNKLKERAKRRLSKDDQV